MSNQGRVLVVDDVSEWREELTEILERAGFLVDSASSMKEALGRLDETLYHLLVLDIRMDPLDPGDASGIDLLRELDTLGLNEAIKVIMLSAYDTKERIKLAFKEYKVADFISKDAFNRQ